MAPDTDKSDDSNAVPPIADRDSELLYLSESGKKLGKTSGD